MVNCYTCYRCQKLGDKIYCPFFVLEECHRGRHRMVIPTDMDCPECTRKKVKLTYNNVKKNSMGYTKRKDILALYQDGLMVECMSSRLGLSVSQVGNFLVAVQRENEISWEELKNIEIVE